MRLKDAEPELMGRAEAILDEELLHFKAQRSDVAAVLEAAKGRAMHGGEQFVWFAPKDARERAEHATARALRRIGRAEGLGIGSGDTVTADVVVRELLK